LLIYGACREDLVIVFGQVLLYYIYVRNLDLKEAWEPLPASLRLFLLSFPFITLLWLSLYLSAHMMRLLHHEQISLSLLIWGSIGQGTFLFRFVSQWLSSERIKTSVLPLNFWGISLIGSAMLLVYAVFRHDPVILIGQLFGAIVYTRNIIIHHRQIKTVAACEYK
jgi:lipid-A-disaccharide synthase-like uncharacterized protein